MFFYPAYSVVPIFSHVNSQWRRCYAVAWDDEQPLPGNEKQALVRAVPAGA